MAALTIKNSIIDNLGDFYTYDYDIPAVTAAIQQGTITSAKPNDEWIPFVVRGDLSVAWAVMIKGKSLRTVAITVTNLSLADKASPDKVFSAVEKGLLRSAWGADDNEWVDLPGPAEWWPDSPDWYARHGFEVRADLRIEYKKAMFAVQRLPCLPEWEQFLLHEGARYDYVWHPFFGMA